jgi:hypothetical protein
MANETYTLIQKTTLNASAASITFSSIPQTFTDLVVKVSLKTTRTTDYVDDFRLTFNGSSTGYSFKGVANYNGTVRSDQNASASYIYANAATASHASQTPNTFCNSEIYVPNYTSANNKSVSIDSTTEQNGTQIWQNLQAALWSNSAAINSITLVPDVAANFVQYSSVSLYGVAKYGVTPASSPKATGGDIITNDGTYWIHQFLNSGTFTPSQTLSCDYLVVAGGGGGGGTGGGSSRSGAGGGAGGLRSTVTATGGGGTLETSLSVTAQTYAVTVGAGGAVSTSGSNSIFSTITSTGGGRGGFTDGSTKYAGLAGGSGGGGCGGFGIGGPVGAGTNNQGFGGVTGGISFSGTGGGAGAIGGEGSGNIGATGGAGVATSITGTSVTRAGGGGGGGISGGGAGGAGGGGAGGGGSAGSAGTINTGGGGGGSATTGAGDPGGAGGSGIVIIRYAM